MPLPSDSPGITSMDAEPLRIQGARAHNLKDVSLELPLGVWISVVGVSGAGKTSLVRDTLLAEGQRRYLDCCSPAIRQQLDQVERPDVEEITGLPLPLAMDEEALPQGRRATIASVTELQDLLAGLFARLGKVVCSNCGVEVKAHNAQSLVEFCRQLPAKTRLQVLFPLDGRRGTSLEKIRGEAISRGFTRFLLGDRILNSDDAIDNAHSNEPLWCVVDRLTNEDESRLAEAFETAFREGHGECAVLIPAEAGNSESPRMTIDGKSWSLETFSQDWRCLKCKTPYLAPAPNLFRFHSPYGACPVCLGTGTAPHTLKRKKALESEVQVCPACQGNRLRPEALAVRIEGQNIAQVCEGNATSLQTWLANLPRGLWQSDCSETLVPYPSPPAPLPQGARGENCETLLTQMERRVEGLMELDLGRLPLNRATQTLSAGEAQRLVLVQLASVDLVNALLLLDEPTRGLHLRDREKVRQFLRRFQRQGNTLVVVENAADFVAESQWTVQMGPGAGRAGGEIVFSGTTPEFWNTEGGKSLREAFPRSGTPRMPKGWLSVTGELLPRWGAGTYRLPMGVLCSLVGISGSGKSLLLKMLAQRIPIGEQVDEVILMQSGSARMSSRSFTASLCRVWPEIRQLLSETEDAKQRNYTAGTFSLNSATSGRCAICEGVGTQVVPMHFLPDVTVTCPECHGQRFQREVLDVRYRGLNPAEILNLTVQESLTHFRGQGSLLRKLTAMKGLGLEYLPLGQPGETLSQGERQRIKLAEHLSRRSGRRTLFLLDEPASGLHRLDLERLLESFSQLVAAGHSIIAAENHPAFIQATDYMVELSEEEGKPALTAQGPPSEVLNHPQSLTGTALCQLLAQGSLLKQPHS